MQSLVHVVGLVLAAVGVLLFMADQLGGRGRGEAGAAVWRFQVQGPPALVLTIVGLAVFLLPFVWWPVDPAPPDPDVVAVPGVVGTDLQQAMDTLARNDLGAAPEPSPEDCAAQGRPEVVVDQHPVQGETVLRGNRVMVFLGCG